MGDIYAFIVLDKTSINVCNYYLLLELGDPERFHNLLDRSDQSTHFLFYKNTFYKNIEPQLWGDFKNIFIAKIAKITKVVQF